MNVVVNGLMTKYERTGKGKAVLCLPGWADTGASFSKLSQQLQNDYEVITLDMPGFGGTQPPPNAWGLTDYSEFLKDWLKKIDAESIHGLIGHSYGGAVAITALSKKNIKADKLVLIASAGIRSKKSAQKRTLQVVAKAGKLPLLLLPPGKRRSIRKKFYHTIGSDLTLLPHMELTFKRIINEDVQAMAKELELPTLLVYGSKDKDTPVQDGKKLSAAIKKSRLVVVSAGHFLHQEQPAPVAKLIETFLKDRQW